MPKKKYVPLYKTFLLFGLHDGVPVALGSYKRLADIPRIKGTYIQIVYMQGEVPKFECFPWHDHYPTYRFLRLKMAGVCTPEDYLKISIDKMTEILYDSIDEKYRKRVKRMRGILRRHLKIKAKEDGEEETGGEID